MSAPPQDEMGILIQAAHEIGNDKQPYKNVQEAFRVFARKVHRMRSELAARQNVRRDGPTMLGKRSDLDDEIPF